MNLKEQLLSEGIGERELHHYTDLLSLFDILKSKSINGFDYNSFLEGDKGKKVISTVRPSMANKKNLEKISGNASGGVKIIVDGSKLSDTVRGVKMKPIAEYPLIDMNVIKTTMKPGKKINTFLNKMFGLMKAKQTAVIKDKIDKLLTDNIHEEKIDTVRTLTRAALRDFVHREGEERIVLKKGNLPLNAKYLKIELHNKLMHKRINSYRRKLLLDNKKYFVINDVYKKLTKEPEGKTLKKFVEE